MALFRQTGLICEDSIVHPQMNTVLNKKLETSGVDYPANSWAKNVNIMAVMPTKTASGSILTITDSADDVQLKEGKFNIAYNSNGLSSMAIKRCGKNIANIKPFNDWVRAGSYLVFRNLFPSCLVNMSFSDNDTTVDISGINFGFVANDYESGTLSTDQYKWCISNGVVQSNTSNVPQSGDTSILLNSLIVYPRTEETYNKIFARFKIQIELGLTATAYEAYSGNTYPVTFGTTIYGGYFESETGVLTSTKASDGTDLATPVEYQLSKVDVMLSSGVNNLFCNTGTSEVEYYTESSGGGVTPIFAATVLVDNSEAATSFTLSDDFEDYDFIAVEITSTSLGTIRIVTLPEVLTEIFTYSSGKCCFDFWNSNNYCCYSHSGRVWTRTNNHYSNITKITGYKCTNMTVTKTTVYNKQGISATGGVITSASSLFDYDYLFFATCSGDPTETQPCNLPICTGQKEIMLGATIVENKYNQLNTIYVNEFDVTTWVNWFMCVGVSFS